MRVSGETGGGIGNRSMMTRGGGFGASRLRLPPPARHHLRCPGSIASRCFDRSAIFDNIASRCFDRFAIFDRIASRCSRCFDRSAIFDLRTKVTVILTFLRRTLLLENGDMGPPINFRAPSRWRASGPLEVSSKS